jgi:hypothetical protein
MARWQQITKVLVHRWTFAIVLVNGRDASIATFPQALRPARWRLASLPDHTRIGGTLLVNRRSTSAVTGECSSLNMGVTFR